MNQLDETLPSRTTWKQDMPTVYPERPYKMTGRLCTGGEFLQALIKQIRGYSRKGGEYQTLPCQFGRRPNTTSDTYSGTPHKTKEKHHLRQIKDLLCSPVLRVQSSRACHWRNQQPRLFLLPVLTSALLPSL